MNDERLDQLIDAHLNGEMTEAERRELEERLLHSAADRVRFWELAETHTVLHEAMQRQLAGLALDHQERLLQHIRHGREIAHQRRDEALDPRLMADEKLKDLLFTVVRHKRIIAGPARSLAINWRMRNQFATHGVGIQGL